MKKAMNGNHAILWALFLVAAGSAPVVATEPVASVVSAVGDQALGRIPESAWVPGCTADPRHLRVACVVFVPRYRTEGDIRDYFRSLVGKDRETLKYVVVDDSRIGPFNEVLRGTPVFSPTGTRLAFAGLRGKRWFVVVNGEESGPYDDLVGGLEFSPDGERFAYAAESEGRAFVTVDGVRQAGYDELGRGSLTFSPDGKSVAYIARRGGDWFVVTDGSERRPAHGTIVPDAGLAVGSGGSKLAFAESRGRRSCMVVDGREGPQYKEVSHPVLSPDGARLAYKVKVGKRSQALVVDGVPGEEYREVSGPVFSPDGTRVAYVAMRQKEEFVVVVDGVEGRVYPGVGMPAFSPDGRHLAYQAHDGEQAFVVVDGIEVGEYDFFSWRFEPRFRQETLLTAVFVEHGEFHRAVVRLASAEDEKGGPR